MASSELFGFSFLLPATQRRSEQLLQKVGLEESVRQAIIHILSTEKGERALFPHYGAQLRRFMFRKNDEALRREIGEHALLALSEFEPRAEFEAVEVKSGEGAKKDE